MTHIQGRPVCVCPWGGKAKRINLLELSQRITNIKRIRVLDPNQYSLTFVLLSALFPLVYTCPRLSYFVVFVVTLAALNWTACNGMRRCRHQPSFSLETPELPCARSLPWCAREKENLWWTAPPGCGNAPSSILWTASSRLWCAEARVNLFVDVGLCIGNAGLLIYRYIDFSLLLSRKTIYHVFPHI